MIRTKDGDFNPVAKWCKIFIVLFFLPPVLHSQDQNIKFEHITTEQGLSYPSVTCILKDSFGMMWFGTLNGLNRYDGYTFRQYKNVPGDSTSLSFNLITDIYEDRGGRLWIATYGGLCRYYRMHDKFVRYLSSWGDSTSLTSNIVLAIFEQRFNNKNTLWINAIGAMHRYNQSTDDFTRYDPEEGKYEKNASFVQSIIQDSTGRLWIGTNHEGLFYYDLQSDRFIRYKVHPAYRTLFQNSRVRSIIATRENGEDILWVSRRNVGDIFKISLKSGEIRQYYFGKAEFDLDLFLDKRSKGRKIWIGSISGLYSLDTFTGKISRISNPGYQQGPDLERINTIYQALPEILWLGSDHGIYKLDLQGKNFTTIRSDPGNPNTLSHNSVFSICQTGPIEKRILWIGTDKGLNRLDINSGSFAHFLNDPNNPASLTSDEVFQILKGDISDSEILWVATSSGFNKLDPVTGLIRRYYIPDQDYVNANQVWAICQDDRLNLWLGLGNSVLYRFNPKTETFTRYRGASKSINTLYMDSFGYMWIGSMSGLIKFNMMTDEGSRYIAPEDYQKATTLYTYDDDDSNTISYNDVTSIYEDSQHTLWVGTAGGLNKFNRESETFIRYGEKHGLPGSFISAILEDDQGDLWISTDGGISKFNQQENYFKNYDAGDGLQGNIFNLAAYKSPEGELFFGGKNGLTYFHPARINENRRIPPVILTGFRIFNKPVYPNPGSVLKEAITTTREIRLPYDQSVFSFEFAALDYANPQKNQYAYRMEAVDPDWVYTDASRRFATYTNLDPGEYIFRVKGSNNDGIWNKEGTSIKITILPPWWRTNWAYSFYVLFILSMLYSVWRFQTNRLKMRQQMEMEHFEAEKLREVDHLKSSFFANISHEFRTPLTLIQGPVRQMLSGEFKGNLKAQYSMILRYSNRLLNLINQILDLSKLESGRMILRATCTDLTQFLKGIVQSFASLADRKKITLKLKVDQEPIMGFVDRDKLEKILTNLLSNAFKFTPEGGEVVVTLDIPVSPPVSPGGRPSKEGTVESPFTKGGHRGILISIFNSGAGIPRDQLDKIFDRFYQADESYTKDSEGTGIGLALTKELVEAHHGEIRVESELNKGTTFTVWLPIEKEHFKPEEIVEEHVDVGGEQRSPLPIAHGGEEAEVETIEAMPLKQHAVTLKSAPILLIVEDNPDVTAYISSFLENDYRISTSENGQIGLKKALNKFPDLIISDVMMPVMDGFQFCRKLKSDRRTSHIPLILLTAKADMESKLEGLEFGADDYVTKPFDAKELSVRCKNLLEQRRRLKEHFQRAVDFQPSEITINSIDEQFMQKVIELIEQHMDDTDFTVERFSREVGMSSRNLSRKLLAVTNYSTREFIRTMRLKRAAQLLKEKSDQITQIAYQVGFNNPSYFAECFRRQFGISPSKYSARYS